MLGNKHQKIFKFGWSSFHFSDSKTCFITDHQCSWEQFLQFFFQMLFNLYAPSRAYVGSCFGSLLFRLWKWSTKFEIQSSDFVKNAELNQYYAHLKYQYIILLLLIFIFSFYFISNIWWAFASATDFLRYKANKSLLLTKTPFQLRFLVFMYKAVYVHVNIQTAFVCVIMYIYSVRVKKNVCIHEFAHMRW